MEEYTESERAGAEETTKAEPDENVSALLLLLGLADTQENRVKAEFAYTLAAEQVEAYCNIDEIPAGLCMTVRRIAAAIYRESAPGESAVPLYVSSVRVGDTTTSFARAGTSDGAAGDILLPYRNILNRYRKVRWRR